MQIVQVWLIAFSSIFEVGVYVVANKLRDRFPLYQLGVLFGFLFAFYLIRKFMSKMNPQRRNSLCIFGLLTLLFLVIGDLLLLINQWSAAAYQVEIYGILFSLFLILAMLAFLLIRQDQLRVVNEQQASLLQRQKQDEKYYEDLKAFDQVLKKEKHDILDSMGVILQLLEEEKTEDAKHFLHNKTDGIKLSTPRYLSGQAAFNALLSLKLRQAEEQKTELMLTIHEENACPLEETDLVSIVSNLLNNALTACKKVECKPWIAFNMKKHKSMYIIKVENTANEDYHYEDGKLTSIKKDAGHGVGIPSVKKTLERYRGTLIVEADKERFIVTIVLPLDEARQ